VEEPYGRSSSPGMESGSPLPCHPVPAVLGMRSLCRRSADAVFSDEDIEEALSGRQLNLRFTWGQESLAPARRSNVLDLN
jgi:hypothetical protein